MISGGENERKQYNKEKDEEMKNRLDRSLEEIRALKAAETLLVENLSEKDKNLKNLSEEKNKYINTINQKHREIQMLEQEKKELFTEYGRHQNIVTENRTIKEDIIKIIK